LLTSATSIPNPRRGFTLIELLVVIGVIVLLVGIALPALVHARRQAQRTAMAMNLQAIATALEAYKLDHGDYPRLPISSQRNTTNPPHDYGSMLLCRALIGPAPAAIDGADSYGFRIRPGGSGRVYGPYLDPSKFKLVQAVKNDDNTWEIRDGHLADVSSDPLTAQYGSPILYYPARPTKLDLSQTPPKYTGSLTYPFLVNGRDPRVNSGNGDTSLPGGGGDMGLFNVEDNKDSAGNPRLSRLQLLLAVEPQYPIWSSPPSATLPNVFPAPAARPVWAQTSGTFTGPFLLWTAGQDGFYAATDNTTGKERVSSDDITNITP